MTASLLIPDEHLDFVLEATGVGVWRIDLRGGTMACSDTCKANYGFAPDETFRFSDLETLIHPDDLEGWSRDIATAIEQMRDFELEYRITTRQGELRWLHVHGRVAVSENGQAEYLAGISRNITERKVAELSLRSAAEGRSQSEINLRRTRDQLSLAIEAAQIGTWFCPMPLHEIIWNDKCREHFWLPPGAGINVELALSIIHPEDRDRTRRALDLAIHQGIDYDIEYRTVSPERHIRWIHAIGRTFYNPDGTPDHLAGVTMDVTEKHAPPSGLSVRIQ